MYTLKNKNVRFICDKYVLVLYHFPIVPPDKFHGLIYQSKKITSQKQNTLFFRTGNAHPMVLEPQSTFMIWYFMN